MRVWLVLAGVTLSGCLPVAEPAAPDAAAPSGYVFDEEVSAPAATDAAPDTEPDVPKEASLDAEQEIEPPTSPRRDPNAEARTRCTRRDGQFTRTAAGLFVCVTRTRDANRACSAARDCEGACLARSGTCAPITPLIGCHDLITASGGMATVCVD